MTDLPRSTELERVPSVAVDFRTVFESNFSYVWNTLRRLGVQEADLKDQVQEVFLTVHQLLGDYDPSRRMHSWLFGIAYRYAARYRGLARHKREVISDEVESISNTPLADEQLATLQTQALVLEAVETIDLARRAVFVMAEIDGHSMPEIAEALGIPLNTAYSRLRLAREDFASAVKRIHARRGKR